MNRQTRCCFIKGLPLGADLAAKKRTPNYSLIVPDTCNDAHNGGPTCGLATADAWLASNVPQILKSREIICVVPDARKARAVEACLQGDVSPMAPASILRTHARTTLYLDRESAALLQAAIRGPILADDAA